MNVMISGQIIATSHDLSSKGSSGREIPLFQGNLCLWNITIWLDEFVDLCYLEKNMTSACPEMLLLPWLGGGSLHDWYISNYIISCHIMWYYVMYIYTCNVNVPVVSHNIWCMTKHPERPLCPGKACRERSRLQSWLCWQHEQRRGASAKVAEMRGDIVQSLFWKFETPKYVLCFIVACILIIVACSCYSCSL